MPQLDLFAAQPILSGLTLADDFIDPCEEKMAIAGIDAAPLVPFRFQGWTGKRLTASYGWHYDFDNGRTARAQALPSWLIPIRDRAAVFAGLSPELLVQALLIRYDPGAGIGWHRDRPVFDHVVGVSLGVHATMRFRRRREGGFDRFAADLAPRSIYHLHGEARQRWEHSIAEMTRTRWSITFRSLSARFAAQLDGAHGGA